MQSILDNHSKKEQESWKNDGQPGFEPFYICHCQHQNWEKGKKDEQKDPPHHPDMSQTSVDFMDGCFHLTPFA